MSELLCMMYGLSRSPGCQVIDMQTEKLIHTVISRFSAITGIEARQGHPTAFVLAVEHPRRCNVQCHHPTLCILNAHRSRIAASEQDNHDDGLRLRTGWERKIRICGV